MGGELEGFKILVVGELYLPSLAIEQSLHRAGATVIGPLADLEAALERTRTEAISGAIVDVDLSRGEARHLLDALLAWRVPVILATGLEPAAEPAEYQSIPRLNKPLDEGELQGAVASFFRRREH